MSDKDEKAAADSSDSDSSESEEEEKPAPKKRKAEEAPLTEAKKTKTVKAAAANPTGATTLFVGSLSFNMDDEWLKSEFEEFGCHSARVVWDREKDRSKG